MSTLHRFWGDENGTETLEWGILVGLIIAGLVAAFTAIGLWAAEEISGLQLKLGA